jgi:hypothetical protein
VIAKLAVCIHGMSIDHEPLIAAAMVEDVSLTGLSFPLVRVRPAEMQSQEFATLRHHGLCAIKSIAALGCEEVETRIRAAEKRLRNSRSVDMLLVGKPCRTAIDVNRVREISIKNRPFVVTPAHQGTNGSRITSFPIRSHSHEVHHFRCRIDDIGWPEWSHRAIARSSGLKC